MSRGLPFSCRGIFIVSALAVMAGSMILLAGCGGGEEDEYVEQPTPRHLVPKDAADSVSVEAISGTVEESSYEAGTLGDSPGVTESVAAGDLSHAEQEAELKAAPAQKVDNSETASTRPPVAAATSSGDGTYNLQLGSFTSRANARQQADRIQSLGYSPVIEETVLAGETYHRVMLKNVGDMAAASKLGEHIHSELDIAYLVRRAN